MKQTLRLFSTQTRVFLALAIVLAGLVFGGFSISHYLNARASMPNGVQINAGGGDDAPFVADEDFNGANVCGGTNAAINTSGVSNPAPQGVYQTNRCGNFSYNIPNLTPNASYTVRLHFAETYWTQAGQRIFNVKLNGQQVLNNFDILATAGAADKAVVEQFSATANASGMVTIQFITVKDNALVSGIEVLGGSTPAPSSGNELGINVGGLAVASFVADTDFTGGIPSTRTNTIDTSGVSNPDPQAVYQSYRYGNFTYSIPNLTPNVSYTVRLDFAEIYWTKVGQRIFNVKLNGQQVLNNFDILATAGGANKAIAKQFTTTADANGKITIQFLTVKDNALVSGLEILGGNVNQNGTSGSSTEVGGNTLTPIPSSGGTGNPSVGSAGTNWTMYHNDLARTGYLPNTPDPQQLTSAWQQPLDGKVYAEPLVVGGHVIVATEHDTIYSLDANTGQIQWHTSVGTPEPQAQLPCGDIDPLGITGTPVYDPATKLIFAVAEVQGGTHTLVGLDVQTGAIKVQRSADIPAMDPKAHQQRAALALWKNMVYFTYGGLAGDCSDYIGTIVGAQTDGQGPLLSYRVPTAREGGIWGTSGPSIDANGNIYIAVGNGAASNGTWDHSDSVLRLSPTLQLEDGFAPADWGAQNAGDQDLGSMGPVLLPNNQIFADGKAGTGYLLNASNMGGIGGELQKQSTCNAFGGAATVGSTIFVPCSNGILQLTIGPGATINSGWKASGGINNSPIVGGHTVYSATGGILYALNSQTGAVRAQINLSGSAERFATPTLSGNLIFVGTSSGISAVTIS